MFFKMAQGGLWINSSFTVKMNFDIKMEDFCQKAWLIVRLLKTKTPAVLAYDSVPALFLTILNGCHFSLQC